MVDNSQYRKSEREGVYCCPQIGHNAQIGKNCFLCGHVALGGSSTLGEYVVMGGKSAVADHISVCSKVPTIDDLQVFCITRICFDFFNSQSRNMGNS